MKSYNGNPEVGRPTRSLFLAALLLFMALYAAVVFRTFPPGELCNDRVFFREDYSLHFYDAVVVSQIILERGKTWGYDPFRMAGYPVGALYSMDNKALEIVMALFRPLGPARVFKGFVLAVFLTLPVFLWLAARNFGAGKIETLLSLFLLLAFLWLDKMPIAFTAFGGFSFLFACLLMLFLGSLLYRFLQASGRDSVCAAILFAGALFFWVHLSGVIVFAVLAMAILAWERERLNRKVMLVLGTWALAALASNGPWLALVLRFWHTKTLSQAHAYFAASGWQGVWSDATDPLVWVRKPLLLLAVYGLAGATAPRSRILWSSALFFLFLAYFGDLLPLVEHLEPYRYVIPAFVCLCLPAANGTLRIARSVRRKQVAQTLVFAFVLFLLTVPSFRGATLAEIYTLGDVRLSTQYDPRGTALLEYLERHTSRDGRILMEDAGYAAGGMQYYDSYLLGVLPYYLHREILGGPQPDTPILQHIADFTNGRLFRRPVEEYDEELLRTYLDAYNIHWIVAWSEPSKRAFEALVPTVLEVLTGIDKFTIYAVREPSSFFLKGGGDLQVALDRIEINNATAGEIVLKYHYMEFLETRPVLPLERAPILNSPVGFIRILNEPHHSRILIRSGSLFSQRKASP